MIAIALAGKPKLLIADEPTTALDVTIQDQVIKLLNRLKKEMGMSVLLITHDLGVISQMCDNVAVMYAGYIVEYTDTMTLFASPRHPYTCGLIEAIPSRNKHERPLQAIPALRRVWKICQRAVPLRTPALIAKQSVFRNCRI